MSDSNTPTGYMAAAAVEIPEFERILDELGSLVNRLRCIRETSVTISDALIGVQNTGEGYDDAAKPTVPNYFIVRCAHSLCDFRDEVERLEKVNAKLLHSIKIE